MKLITKRSIIENIKKHWSENYAHHGDSFKFYDGRTVGEIKNSLDNLDLHTCEELDVAFAIGNSAWTENNCDECGKDCKEVVEFGSEDHIEDDEYFPPHLCRNCIEKSLVLFERKE